ncbi:peptide chain release factor N(5)-glutamine methyltransferase [Mesorhizobium sp. M2D.F.Ca.ET.185.01.1.1]|uniref:N5-glutamine methyltransferase family protein n=2 Tax=Mesorhizobium TaxID=68287 RepID=UPI000FCA21D5|nr:MULTISPECIES: HemK/PrmC family methyltransferase [unclassified Mesorhizobium]TGP44348.1 peptide chain release factor N(5)-glutamine methyltransferase [bacterium M00.F.Ca.ET.230.01.1.1]TGP72810.1 peptide chain release factor N(5)-glutamine methyltransferase [bacterium M00.F.Ca.ET.227.01.1.1]TGP84005.1 peptide chain release factor N(5)-glutamine methyltransferase [bacterium M00.F.Ca.ET.221.01.1.1]TGP86027.1 peptide chain release factor N(5)-glutamine methyltransferase [bacterium M00.F.Ca.ET.22
MNREISVEDAYNKGHTTFMGLELLVGPGALVPRPETELLGTTALDALDQLRIAEPRIVDMCCGTGNLACAIAHYAPAARIWASDLTDGCVEVSRRNVAFHGLAGRIAVHQGDLFDAFSELELAGTIDMIVCNPPYISEKRLEGDRSHLIDLEPREAFAAGPYGLSIHMRVIKDAQQYLRPGGILLFEVGLGQDRQVTGLLDRSKSYEDVSVVANELGEGRVVFAYMKSRSGPSAPEA